MTTHCISYDLDNVSADDNQNVLVALVSAGCRPTFYVVPDGQVRNTTSNPFLPYTTVFIETETSANDVKAWATRIITGTGAKLAHLLVVPFSLRTAACWSKS
jgi:hypothetical protein